MQCLMLSCFDVELVDEIVVTPNCINSSPFLRDTSSSLWASFSLISPKDIPCPGFVLVNGIHCISSSVRWKSRTSNSVNSISVNPTSFLNSQLAWMTSAWFIREAFIGLKARRINSFLSSHHFNQALRWLQFTLTKSCRLLYALLYPSLVEASSSWWANGVNSSHFSPVADAFSFADFK